jgi:hypothetical protein
MPRGNLRRTFDRGFVRPHSRANRLKMEANPYRPFKLGSRFRIRRELLRINPWWWVTHRRGIFRPKVGQDPLEARAVPKELVKGTLPERIVYRYCVEKLGMIQGVDMDFQCLAGHHRVLTADLKWVPIKDLCPGDVLLNFSENPIPPKNGVDTARTNRRYFERGVVLSNNPGLEECAKVYLSDGTEIIATLEHPWLIFGRRWMGSRTQNINPSSGVMWAQTQELEIGMKVPRYLPVWDENETKLAGYVQGFFDADGNICHKIKKGRENGIAVTIGQQSGPEFDQITSALTQLGYDFGDGVSFDPRGKAPMHRIAIRGGRAEVMKFLGELRPNKLFHQFEIDKLGRIDRIEELIITRIERIGLHPIYRLGVSNKTYFAEGLGMHNTSLEGGRLEFGGIVIDFTFRFLHIAIQVQGPTHNALARFRKDEEQRLILEQMGYSVIYLDMALIYDQPLFEDTMRAIFLRQGYARGGVHGNHEIDEGVNGQEDELERLSDHVLFLETLFSKVLTGMANEWQV